ncbi:MAG TPA: NAD(P)-dependent oxidoreductase [Gaiellaceae bacterium]|nr:NAD(P)-dependent oxidoreductase [Gaiellaceae bacterium]
MSGRVAGFVGLGEMGGPMARNLLAAGWEVHGYNRTRERAEWLVEHGLTPVDTPRAAAEASSTILVSVFDDEALETVMLGADGLVAGLREGDVVVEMSTVRAETSERLEPHVAARGASLLRAPVSGNPVVVRAGQLTFLCSGDRRAFDAVQDVFDVLGTATRYLGGGEEARYAKLALNLMIACSMQMIAEALTFAERAGIDRGAMLDLMQSSAVGSPFVRYKAQPLLDDDYDVTFSVRGMRKDLGMLLEASRELTVPLPAASLVDQLLAACDGLGWGELDFATLVLLERTQTFGAEAVPQITPTIDLSRGASTS